MKYFSTIVIAAIALTVIATASIAFEDYSGSVATKAQMNLEAIAMEKEIDVEIFLSERISDAAVLANRPSIFQLLDEENAGGSSGGVPPSSVSLVKLVAKTYGYHDVRVVDRALNTLISIDPEQVQPVELAAFKAVMATRKPAMVDLHVSADCKPCFGVADPVFQDGQPDKLVVGVVYVEMDAQTRLYPLLEFRSKQTNSAETLLVERQAGQLVYLSPLRYAPTAAPLSVRGTLNDSGFVGSDVVSANRPTLIVGRDYRGVAVLGAVIPLPGTNWFIAAKIDKAEIRRPLDILSDVILLAAAQLLLLAMVGGSLLWRGKHAAIIDAQLRSAQRYKAASQAAIDGFFELSETGHVEDANHAFLRMTGYEYDELIGKPLSELKANRSPDQIAELLQSVRESGAVRYPSQWRRKDGKILESEVSIGYVASPGGGAFLAFLRDVGPELAAKRRIERLNSFNLFLNHANAAIFNLTTQEAILTEICETAVRDAGFVLAWGGMLDEATGGVSVVAASGSAKDYLKELVVTTDLALPTSRGPSRMSMVEKRIIYTNDFLADSMTAPWHGLAQKYGIRANAAVPVIVDGNAIAALTFYSSERNYFDAELMALLEEAVNNVSLALSKVRAEQGAVRAEAARHAGEARFYWAFEASPIPMMLISLSSRETNFINEALKRCFGYSLEDIPNQAAWFEKVYPEQVVRQQGLDHWNNVELPQATAEIGHVVESPELSLRCKDGSTRVFRSYMLVNGDDIIVQWQDLTEIKAAEAELTANERRFRDMIEQPLMGIYVQQDDRLVYANPRLADIMGYGIDELLGRDTLDFFADHATREQIKEGRRRMSAGEVGVIYDLQIPLRRKDGKVIELAIHRSAARWNGRQAFICIVQDITELKRAQERIAAHVAELEAALEITLQAVATMVEMRDPYTAGHERRVGIVAADIAREMGWPEERCHGLQLVGLVHDIGKIAVPTEILSKPSLLTPLEYELVKIHVERGYEILKDVKSRLPIADIVRQHHEHIDGTGYPHGLKGSEILLEARILTVADVMEATASHRPYRQSLGVDAGLQEILDHRGTWYDPEVVDAVLRMFRDKGYVLPK